MPEVLHFGSIVTWRVGREVMVIERVLAAVGQELEERVWMRDLGASAQFGGRRKQSKCGHQQRQSPDALEVSARGSGPR
jgi:hypothetical protein